MGHRALGVRLWGFSGEMSTAAGAGCFLVIKVDGLEVVV